MDGFVWLFLLLILKCGVNKCYLILSIRCREIEFKVALSGPSYREITVRNVEIRQIDPDNLQQNPLYSKTSG